MKALSTLMLILLLFSLSAVNAAGPPPYLVSAWTFGDRSSLSQACDRNAIDEVSVDWYMSTRSGGIRSSGEDLSFVDEAHNRGLRVLATVSNYNGNLGDFDTSIATHILANGNLRNQHAAKIAQLCQKKGYEGIDLDWESVRAADRNRFSLFVGELARRLHQKGKILSIAIHSKTSEPGDWFGAKAEDWKAIGAVVDVFKIMTYDYSGSWSDPGPIAPPSWADEVLAFAETLVPAYKIMMGVPFYGREWWGKNNTDDLTYNDVQDLVAKYNPTIRRDSESREATFHFTGTDRLYHQVYFQDRTAISAKLQMLRDRHPGISGIAIWCMCDEMPEFWDEIAIQLK